MGAVTARPAVESAKCTASVNPPAETLQGAAEKKMEEP